MLPPVSLRASVVHTIHPTNNTDNWPRVFVKSRNALHTSSHTSQRTAEMHGANRHPEHNNLTKKRSDREDLPQKHKSRMMHTAQDNIRCLERHTEEAKGNSQSARSAPLSRIDPINWYKNKPWLDQSPGETISLHAPSVQQSPQESSTTTHQGAERCMPESCFASSTPNKKHNFTVQNSLRHRASPRGIP